MVKIHKILTVATAVSILSAIGYAAESTDDNRNNVGANKVSLQSPGYMFEKEIDQSGQTRRKTFVKTPGKVKVEVNNPITQVLNWFLGVSGYNT